MENGADQFFHSQKNVFILALLKAQNLARAEESCKVANWRGADEARQHKSSSARRSIKGGTDYGTG